MVSVTRDDLPGARDARDHGEGPQLDLDGDVPEVVGPCANHLEAAAPGLAAALGQRDHAPSREVGAREGVRVLHDLPRGAAGDHGAAHLARPRAHVHHVVGGANGVLVVLDHDHGVAHVAQALERCDEAVVVALVEPDGGLVQDVEDAHEAGAYLGREPDALRLSARERGGGAAEREVVQAHVDHELQAGDDLLHYGRADEALPLGELQALEELQRLPAAEVADLHDVLVAHGDGQVLGLEPPAVARGARLLADVALQVLAHGLGGRLLVLVKQDGAHARELGGPVGVAPVARVILHGDLGVTQAVEKGLARLGLEPLPRGRGVLAHVAHHRRDDLRVVVGVAEDASEGAARGRQRRVVDQGLRIDHAPDAQAVAVGAGAVGGVEREVAGLQVVDGVAVLGAGQGEGVLEKLALRPPRGVTRRQEVEPHLARGQPGGSLDRLGDAAQRGLAYDHAVHDDLDRVLVLLVEPDVLVQVADLAVHADAREALLAQVLEELGVLALPAQHHGRQHEGAPPLSRGKDLVCHLVGGLPLDDAPALGAVRGAYARVEQAQVVVDLGDGAHRGAGVAARGLLVDRDRGRQAIDGVEVGLVHLSQEHAGVAREGLNVAALPLRVDGVERQARLARAREARDHHELVAGYGDVHVAEVVLARRG